MTERYGKIAWINLKHNLFPYLAAAALLCFGAPLFIGTENLDVLQSAKVIEMYLTFLGIILLPPVFFPEMNQEARDVIRTKKEPILVSYTIRILQGCVFLVLFGIGFLWYMKSGNCDFTFYQAIIAFLANTCFTGGIALAVFSFTDHVVFAYMVPIAYYIANMGAGAKYLGKFYLFSMQAGKIEDKAYLLAGGILLIVLAIWHKRQ